MQPVTTLGAIGMTNGGTVSADITVRNNTLNSLAGGRGISMTSDGGVLRMLVDNNSIDGLGSTSKSAVHVNFTDNISLGTAAAGHVTVTNNHIGQQGALWTSGDGLANAILLQTQAAATMTGLISGNVVDANTTSIIEVSRVRAIGTSAMNVIVTNNDLEDTSGTRVEFDATTASSGAINLDISDNTIATIVGVIKLSETAGTLNVEQSSAAAVSIANNGATVTSTGSPQFGTGNPPVPALPTLPM
jgi:hypothetical protein